MMYNQNHIYKLVSDKVMNHPGVSRISSGFTDNIQLNLLHKSPDSVGIKLEFSEDNKIKVDIKIIVKFNYNIPQLVYDIQSMLRSELEEHLNITVEAINILVEGVDRNE